jgi:hypothetical protein
MKSEIDATPDLPEFKEIHIGGDGSHSPVFLQTVAGVAGMSHKTQECKPIPENVEKYKKINEQVFPVPLYKIRYGSRRTGKHPVPEFIPCCDRLIPFG